MRKRVGSSCRCRRQSSRCPFEAKWSASPEKRCQLSGLSAAIARNMHDSTSSISSRMHSVKLLDWARVVFVSSESAIFVPKEMVHYGFSKSAQLVIARGAAEMTKGTNVTVNSVLPGPTWVEMQSVRLGERAKAQGTTVEDLASRTFTERRPASLLQRYATPGRSRQSDLLRVFEGVERDQRRRSAGRRWHRDKSILKPSSDRRKARGNSHLPGCRVAAIFGNRA
jgi:NAD(P)-dependent dehydrogenase (short-subunit alcohol dehydrogenase family)